MSEKSSKTVSEKIWNDIKDRKVQMFALPDQCVQDYCMPIEVDPFRLFLTAHHKGKNVKIPGAFFAALDTALAPKYIVERIDKYIVITPNHEV